MTRICSDWLNMIGLNLCYQSLAQQCKRRELVRIILPVTSYPQRLDLGSGQEIKKVFMVNLINVGPFIEDRMKEKKMNFFIISVANVINFFCRKVQKIFKSIKIGLKIISSKRKSLFNVKLSKQDIQAIIIMTLL